MRGLPVDFDLDGATMTLSRVTGSNFFVFGLGAAVVVVADVAPVVDSLAAVVDVVVVVAVAVGVVLVVVLLEMLVILIGFDVWDDDVSLEDDANEWSRYSCLLSVLEAKLSISLLSSTKLETETKLPRMMELLALFFKSPDRSGLNVHCQRRNERLVSSKELGVINTHLQGLLV